MISVFAYVKWVCALQPESTKPNQLIFKVAGPLASGKYTCEITVETPSFVTLKNSHQLKIVGITQEIGHLS